MKRPVFSLLKTVYRVEEYFSVTVKVSLPYLRGQIEHIFHDIPQPYLQITLTILYLIASFIANESAKKSRK